MVWLEKCKLLFCSTFMKNSRTTYNAFNLVSAIFMILALLWLTISAPFVVAGQQEFAKHDKAVKSGMPIPGNEEEAANPFGNTTEEKAPVGSGSLSEEYLHDHHITDHFFSTILQYHKCENADTYNAFHGELLVPPPNAA